MARRDIDLQFGGPGGSLFQRPGSRLVSFAGCINFRDIGGVSLGTGIALASRQLFRTAGLHHVNSETAYAIVSGLGIRTFVDLRTKSEIDRDGYPVAFASLGVRYVHAPIRSERLASQLQANPSDYARIYLAMLRDNADGLRDALLNIANGHWPLAFGCSLGKDRTGVVTAMILLECGALQHQ